MKLRVVIEPHDGATHADQLAAARAAEELGFDGFFRSDHYMPLPGNDGLPGPTDAWATLAALAVQTSKIRLGTLVSAATFRLPGPLAIMRQIDAPSTHSLTSHEGPPDCSHRTDTLPRHGGPGCARARDPARG